MNNDRQSYARDTYLDVVMPFGIFRGGAVLCSDGQVRRLKRISLTADTFFSIPAAVTVQGKTVAGYVTVETVSGLSTETPDDPNVAKFVAYTYGKNGRLLPEGGYRERVA